MRPVFLDPIPQVDARPAPPRPLALSAVGLAAGILFDNAYAVSWNWLAAAAAISLGCVVLSHRFPRLLVAAIALMAAVLGILRHDAAVRLIPGEDVSRYDGPNSPLASVVGRIVDAPRILLPDRSQPLRAVPLSPRTRFVLDATALIDTHGPSRPASGRVLVSASCALTNLEPGDTVCVFGRLGRFAGPANPGEFDRAQYLRRRGLRLGLYVNTPDAVRLVERPAGGWAARALARLRLRLLEALHDTGADVIDADAASLLSAMVLAQRSAVERTLNDAYARTGNSHLLAASGLNVGWLALLALAVARPLRLSVRASALMVMAVVTTYALLAEPNPPILRAALMADLGCLAALRTVRFNTVNWLAASAIILLLADPAAIFQAGFQLSFAVLLGIFLIPPRLSELYRRLAERVTRRAAPPDTDQALFAETSWPRFIRLLIQRFFRATALVSVAAWLTGTPLAAWHFGVVSPWGWLNAALLAPLAFVVMTLGFVKLLTTLAWPSTALIFGPLTEGACDLMNGLVRSLARVPCVSLAVPPLGWQWVAACYAALAAWAVRTPARDSLGGIPASPETTPTPMFFARLGRIALPLCAAALIVWPAVRLWATPRDPETLTVWTLAVGDGTACVLQMPDGETWLYDCGSRSPYDAAATTVLPFLRARNIRRIDRAFVSHPDLDHFSAMEPLITAGLIRRLVLNEHYESFAPPGSAAARFLGRARDAGVQVESICTEQRWTGRAGWQVDVLWPPPAGAFINNANNSSTVLRVAWRGRSILLTGDITQYGLDQLVERGGLECDAMHLPHHGSVAGGSTARFLAAADPRIGIRSAARRNDDTHNGLLELMAGREYFNTADDGCVRTDLAAEGLRVTPFRRRPEIPEPAADFSRRGAAPPQARLR